MPDARTSGLYRRRELLAEQAVPLRAQLGVIIGQRAKKQVIDQVTASLRARAAFMAPARREQLLAIDETVRLHRPRQLDGEEPDQAQHWLAAGLADVDVVAWIEAGVYGSTSAQQLRDAGVAPREVAGEYESGVTLGLAFARGEVSIERVLELRRPARLEVSRG